MVKLRCFGERPLVPQFALEKVIHIAASARVNKGKNGGSGSGEMMQLSGWDSFNHPLGFGSVGARSGARSYAKRRDFIQI